MIDVICEMGSFLYYLRKSYRNAELIGFDVVPALLEKVDKELAVKTVRGDISDIETYKDKIYDFR